MTQPQKDAGVAYYRLRTASTVAKGVQTALDMLDEHFASGVVLFTAERHATLVNVRDMSMTI